jgi:ABC-type nitrate/sulfonate/bicarbonate transport system ATPase subunit
VLLVTHDVDEAIELADRVLVLDGGKIKLDLRVELGGGRTRRSPLFIDDREALLSALGVASPRSGLEARASALGSSGFRLGREERLERTA